MTTVRLVVVAQEIAMMATSAAARRAIRLFRWVSIHPIGPLHAVDPIFQFTSFGSFYPKRLPGEVELFVTLPSEGSSHFATDRNSQASAIAQASAIGESS
jgi:hypothetical protein